MPAQLYSAAGSGGVAVEAALALLDQKVELVEACTWDRTGQQAGDRLIIANPLRQVPTLILPDGEVLTESAAILMRLAELHPGAGLAPDVSDPGRGAYLRWMMFVSSAIYSLYWAKADPSRLGAAPRRLREAADARILLCWAAMDGQVAPAPFLSGDTVGMLDIYVTVISSFSPGPEQIAVVAPKLAAVSQRVRNHPRLRALLGARLEHFPIK